MIRRNALICTLALAAPVLANPEPKPADPPATPSAPSQPAAAPGPEQTRESGLIVQDLVVGTGVEIKPGAPVIMHYKGTLKATGEEFDSSYSRGQPLQSELKPGRLIAGWVEGVPGMKIGGKRKLTVPAKLAYGEKGFTDRRTGKQIIPANADLVFEIEAVNTLVMEDVKVGTGAECTGVAQTVSVFYRGTLKDGGTEFDGNIGKSPAVFPLSNLIKGWQLGIPGMKVGGKRNLIVPWQWAYGERGSPPNIPPKADLVFEIELVDIIAATPPTPPTPPPAPATPK